MHYCNDAQNVTSPINLKTMPLIGYSCEYWHTHLKALSVKPPDQMTSMVLPLFANDSMFSLWMLILHTGQGIPLLPYEKPRKKGPPLYHAAFLGILPVVQYLLDNGADANVLSRKLGTPLCGASRNGHIVIAKLLLGHGADISKAETSEQETALHQAAAGGHDDMVKLLVEAGALIDVSDVEGWTPLQVAALHEHLSTASLLLDLGASLENANLHMQTPLHWAAFSNNQVLLAFLIGKGAKINAQNASGETAMHFAASRGDLRILKQLLEAGAQVDIRSHNGRTPLFWAMRAGQIRTTTLLLDYGANLDAEDNAGMTPALIAPYTKDFTDAISESRLSSLKDHLSQAVYTPAGSEENAEAKYLDHKRRLENPTTYRAYTIKKTSMPELDLIDTADLYEQTELKVQRFSKPPWFRHTRKKPHEEDDISTASDLEGAHRTRGKLTEDPIPPNVQKTPWQEEEEEVEISKQEVRESMSAKFSKLSLGERVLI